MPHFAYCDRNGIIDFGEALPEGRLPILKSKRLRTVKLILSARARHAYDGKTLLVPGIPEAGEDSDAALDALHKFRAWLAQSYPRMVASAKA